MTERGGGGGGGSLWRREMAWGKTCLLRLLVAGQEGTLSPQLTLLPAQRHWTLAGACGLTTTLKTKETHFVLF